MPKAKKNVKYKRNYTAEQCKSAIAAAESGVNIFKASKQFGVPYSTLKSQISQIKNGVDATLGRGTHLTAVEESEIVKWVTTCQQLGYPRSWGQVRIAAAQICTNKHGNGCQYYGKTPSWQWLKGFRSRFPKLKTRRSEKLGSASANVRESDIRSWFQNVNSWLEANSKLGILEDSSRVFGADETSFSLSRTSKPVVAMEGTSNVYDVQAGGSHENVTVLYTFAASGITITPFIVFQGKTKPKNVWGDQVVVSASESGWMTADLFQQWLREYFVPELIRRGTKFPVILFVDGHKSHVTLQVSFS